MQKENISVKLALKRRHKKQNSEYSWSNQEFNILMQNEQVYRNGAQTDKNLQISCKNYLKNEKQLSLIDEGLKFLTCKEILDIIFKKYSVPMENQTKPKTDSSNQNKKYI